MNLNETKAHMAATLLVMLAVLALLAIKTGVAKASILDGRLATGSIVLVAAAAIYIFSRRDTWLPFLGQTALPTTLLRLGVPAASQELMTVQVTVDPSATHVAYWAADSSATIDEGPAEAYGAFANSGTTAVEGGVAQLKITCPGAYSVGPSKKALRRHVHFRECFPSGMMGPVKTREIQSCL